MAISDAFPEFNTGVILINKTWRVRRFLSEWKRSYVNDLIQDIDFPSKDQIRFRESLYQSKIRFATLTPEYNCRFTMGCMVSHKVKLLHGRSKDFNKIAEEINLGPVNSWSKEPIVRWVKY